MTKFWRHKSYEEVKAQCEAQGVPLNDEMYRRGGWDTVVVNSRYNVGHYPGHVFYNTFNGNFWGTTPDGLSFDSKPGQHENEPWFQALLDFFFES